MKTYYKKYYIISVVIVMNIYRPILGELIKEENLQLSIEKFRQEGITIENKSICMLEEIDLNCEEIEFEKCIFKDCRTAYSEKVVL